MTIRLCILCLLCSCAVMPYTMFAAIQLETTNSAGNGGLPIIPQPASVQRQSGLFMLSERVVVVAGSANLRDDAALFVEHLRLVCGVQLRVSSSMPTSAKASIQLINGDSSLPQDGYTLTITPNTITIRGGKGAGVWYGLQSLLQLAGAASHTDKQRSIEVPCAVIQDAPRFSWRGMHLDVGRHFQPVEVVKRTIDMLAFYKMNTFHWHLTEDQGWRIEIKKYPRLTQVGAWRKGTLIGHYNDDIPQKFDTVRHGGYYTQKQIKDVVEYACKRHVTIVPEIELPGHALAALAAYPELSCPAENGLGGPFEVGKTWGVFDDVFSPKEATFTFLQNVLTEVIALFPSKYIHIGGDECPKTRWKADPYCQELIKKYNLKDEHGLQSYFIQRIEKFVNSKGRQIIGWDEILEGGLAPNAAVMSWRGIEGGIAAAKEKHFVVMSPGSHCYFDYYQSRNPSEPVAIGGYLPLEKVYGYEPIPAELSGDERKYILGAQANVWTEYMKTASHIEYMVFPRLCALAEVVWTAPERKNYDDFTTRLVAHLPILDKWHINYAKSLFEVELSLNPFSAASGMFGLQVSLQSQALKNNTNRASGFITYTTDGSAPTAQSTRYAAPFALERSVTVKAAVIEGTERKSTVTEQALGINKATGKSVQLAEPPHSKYTNAGAFTLVDGIRGEKRFKGSQWLGFEGKDCEATVDLQTAQSCSTVRVGWYVGEGQWIYAPSSVELWLSDDGQTFRAVGKLDQNDVLKAGQQAVFTVGAASARFVKLKLTNFGTIPVGKTGAGNKPWLMVDEISIE